MVEILNDAKRLNRLSGQERSDLVQRMCNLGLTEHDVTGKTILDIGSGSGVLRRLLGEVGVDTNVIELDPEYSSSKTVLGLAQKLPFKNESFDLVISFASVPIIFKNGYKEIGIYSAQSSIEEALRVTKKGGELRMTPIPSLEWEENRDVRDRQPDLIDFFSTLQGVVETLCENPQYDLHKFSPTLAIKKV